MDSRERYFDRHVGTRQVSSGHGTRIGYLPKPQAAGAEAWKDEKTDILSVQRNGAGITLNVAEATVDFDYNAAYHSTPILADMLYVNMQLNHDRNLTSIIIPHIHWFQAKNYSPNFLVQYRWQINGLAKVTAWTFLKCNNLELPYPGGTIMQVSETAAILSPVGSFLSDIIQFRIYRDTANTSLQFTGNCPYNTGGNASCPVLAFDAHIIIDSIGSTSEYLK